MFNDYFGGLSNGRLASIPFLLRWLILLALFIGVFVGLGAAIGLTERIVGGDLAALQRDLAASLGGPLAIVLLVALLVFVFANLNITAKRARDIGLPGWLTAIVIAMLSGGISQATGQPETGGLGFLLLLILTFLPTDMMRR